MKVLKYVEMTRTCYYETYGRVPLKIFMDEELFKQLRKELIYTPWGYHRLLYYRNSISMLGMEIILHDSCLKVGE